MLTREDVLKALSTVLDPDLGKDLVTLGMIEDVKVEGEKALFTIVLTTPACPLRNQIEQDAKRAVLSMTSAKEVELKTTAKVRQPKPVNVNSNQFKHVIAVGSGKGGVGKSTVAVSLALALVQDGAKVGLLDADIYGPNVPRMLGIDRLPDDTPEGQKIHPAKIHGIKVVSIGFLVQNGQPLIWRGPMLHSAIQQFITDFDWGDLDYLIIDLPPGTGDVQLSLTQTLPVTGSVVVTTPQQVSIDDAYRAVSMFQKLEVPILGIVENMSYMLLPDGEKMNVFGEGGGASLAFRTSTPFLGSIPLDPEIVRGGDIGSPIMYSDKAIPAVEAMREIARKIAAEASKLTYKQSTAG